MATDLCVQYTLDLATDLFLNQGGLSGTTTMIRTTAIRGLDGRPIRATILPNGAADGGDKLTARFGPRLILVEMEGVPCLGIPRPYCAPEDQPVSGSFTSSTPIIRPTPRTSPTVG